MKTYLPHASSFSQISANIIALICCALTLLFGPFGLVVSLILFFTEKYSGLVKYYAMFSSVIWVLKTIVLSIFSAVDGTRVFSGIFFIGWNWGAGVFVSLLRTAVNIAFVIILVLAIVRAYRWQSWRAPAIGNITEYICSRSTAAAYNGDGPVPPFAEQQSNSENHQNWSEPQNGAGSSPHGAPPNQDSENTGPRDPKQ